MLNDIMLENLRLRDVNPLICGEEACEPGHTFGPAARDYYLLHYVLSGKGTFFSGGRSYTVTKGQIFVIRPHEMTCYRADGQDPWHYCWVGFESSLDLSVLFSRDVITTPDCGHVFHALRDSSGVQAGREWYICGKIYELLSLLRAPVAGAPQASEYVRRAVNFIESNYIKDISVEGIAAQLSLDRSYFSTIFKKYTGKSPQKYIVDYRLTRAAELIAVKRYKPTDAARSAGYPDIFNFSRMFKKKFGVSPREYGKAAHQDRQ